MSRSGKPRWWVFALHCLLSGGFSYLAFASASEGLVAKGVSFALLDGGNDSFEVKIGYAAGVICGLLAILFASLAVLASLRAGKPALILLPLIALVAGSGAGLAVLQVSPSSCGLYFSQGQCLPTQGAP